LGKRTLCIATVVDNGILDFVRLHVERSATMIRPTLLCSSDFRDPAGDGSPSHRGRRHLQKRSAIYDLRAFRTRLSLVLRHTCVSSIAVACNTTGAFHRAPVDQHQNPAKPCGLL